MEDILFSVFLYGVVFSFLCWLTTPTTTTSDAATVANSTTSDTATVAVANSSQPARAKSTSTNSENQREGNKAKTRAASVRTTQTPPKAPQPPQSVLTLSQLKTAFAVEPDPDTEAATPAQDTIPPIDPKAIDKLKLRQARKIASQLGIRQKINGKDQPLSWLRSQIKQRLKTDTEVAVPIIRASLAAS
ncbi:MAG: hypothetical protein SAJ12_21185 [Jaaginema sp. PMC 1079.18]|nr:hypothetical protein [Jaaginema sp. PMC 1080.18]MEC4853502.1 hypothetical protein [Jaaginema sp. PMC 1079.18]MEC4866682.1 hypothetical protein [Jaaginema sp. PMC 1078.18]